MLDVLEAILKYTAIAGGCGILLAGAFAFVMIILSPIWMVKEWLEKK